MVEVEPPAESQPSGFKSFFLTVRKRTTIEVPALPQDQPNSDEDTGEPQAREAKLTHF